MSNRYDKMDDYVKTIFHVFLKINKTAELQNDNRLKMTALVIYNYVSYMAKQYEIKLRDIKEKFENNENYEINLIPFFEYISMNNIELYDESKFKLEDLDITNKEHIERYVLSRIYYITQFNK